MEVSISRARPSSSASSFKASRASIRSVYVMYIDENLILTVVKMEELFANAVYIHIFYNWKEIKIQRILIIKR
jgi:hypothetical protein